MGNLHFDYYNEAELSQIVKNNAAKLEIAIEHEAQDLIAKCSRGTPRIANRVLRRVRDFALVDGADRICMDQVTKSLDLMEIDHLGLDRMDRKFFR